MAQRTQVLLTCDVHHGAAEEVETVLYTVEGQSYECDLCDGHLTEFRRIRALGRCAVGRFCHPRPRATARTEQV